MPLRNKIQEWSLRYFLPEITALAVMLIFALGMRYTTGSVFLVAILSPWIESLVYYSVIVIRDAKKQRTSLSFNAWLRLIRNAFIEFGPAEYIDNMIIRPFYLWSFPQVIPQYALALFLASMAANVTFYIPTILSYELRKKYLRE